ncbi:MAG: oligosaccharide flippase family protein [Actinomycetota bacterium]
MTVKENGQPQPLTREAESDVRVVAKGGGVQLLGQMTNAVFSLLFNAVAVRFLGSAGFGLYRQTFQVMSIGGQAGVAGFNLGAVRFLTRARAEGSAGAALSAARTTLLCAAISSGAVFIGLWVFADPLAAAFGDGDASRAELASLFRLGAAYVPLFAIQETARFSTQANRTMVPSVVVGNIVQPVSRFIFGTAALMAGLAVAGAVGALVMSVAVGSVAALRYYRRLLTKRERSAAPSAEVRPIVRFSLLQSGTTLLGVQRMGIGIILLGLLSSDNEVGLFAVALSLQGLVTISLNGIGGIWAPVVSDLYERNEMARLGSLYQTISRWVATFALPVAALLIVDPDLFVQLLAGDKAARAIPLVAILAVGNLFYASTGPSGLLISMTGRPGVNLLISVVTVTSYVVFGYLFVPRYGALAMAYIDASVTVVVNLIRVLLGWRLVGIQPFGRTYLKPVGATAAAVAVLLVWKFALVSSVAVQLAGVLVAAAVYFLVLRVMGLDPEERHVFDRIRAKLPWPPRRTRR